MKKEEKEKSFRNQRQFLIEKKQESPQLSRDLVAYLVEGSSEGHEKIVQYFRELKIGSAACQLEELSLNAEKLEKQMLNEKENLTADPRQLSLLVKGTGQLLHSIECFLTKMTAEDEIVTTSDQSIDQEAVSPRILLADDDAATLNVLEDLLKNRGYDIYITSSVKTAVDYLKSGNIDLAILDKAMVEKSECDIDKVSADLKKDVPVIMLTETLAEGTHDNVTPAFQKVRYHQRSTGSDQLIELISGTFKTEGSQPKKDRLTGASTRKDFIKRFETERQDFIENSAPFSVAFLDIDDFKAVNETYGHLSGDEFLISLVERVRGQLAIGEEVFRFGGDEFLVLFPNKNEEQAKAVIEAVRQASGSQAASFPTDQGNVSITFSSGVAEYNNRAITKTSLLERADKALYVAKENGKNQTLLFTETSDESRNRILVVDDEPLLTNIIKTRLGYLGYEVDNASDGQEALAKLDRHVYDLVLLDLILPKVTGMEVLRKLKDGTGNENLKIIMISEKQNEPAMLKSLTLGADDFFKKPFSLNVLEHKIKKIMTA